MIVVFYFVVSVHKAAVLCLAWEQEILISGSYDKSIVLWDLRGESDQI